MLTYILIGMFVVFLLFLIFILLAAFRVSKQADQWTRDAVRREQERKNQS